MKTIPYTLILLAVLLTVSAYTLLPEKDKPIKLESEKVILVELFTSQGCSSCPSADKLLKESMTKAEEMGVTLLGLSFHVSYWNYLGWKDPYSSQTYTNRQRKYGESFGLRSIYTPQMVVNGKSEFVGSNRLRLAQSIKSNLLKEAQGQIAAEIKQKNGLYEISYSLEDHKSGTVLNVALVDDHVENYVSRGENKGRNLSHDNVVRSFKTFPAKKSATVGLSIPKKFDFDQGSAILFVQDKTSMEVLSAVRLTPK